MVEERLKSKVISFYYDTQKKIQLHQSSASKQKHKKNKKIKRKTLQLQFILWLHQLRWNVFRTALPMEESCIVQIRISKATPKNFNKKHPISTFPKDLLFLGAK